MGTISSHVARNASVRREAPDSPLGGVPLISTGFDAASVVQQRTKTHGFCRFLVFADRSEIRMASVFSDDTTPLGSGDNREDTR